MVYVHCLTNIFIDKKATLWDGMRRAGKSVQINKRTINK